MRALCFAAAGALAVVLSAAVQQAPHPRFDIISIKPSAPGEPVSRHSMQFQIGGYWTRRAEWLDGLISYAFLLPGGRIEGIPDWAKHAKYDIEVRMPPTTTEAQFHLMLQQMLADRFHMTWRTEMRPTDVSLLTAGAPGPDLHPAAGHCLEPGTAAAPGGNQHACGQIGLVKIKKGSEEIAGYSVTMADFASFFSRAGVHPVVNDTGSQALYDFDITLLAPPPVRGESGADELFDSEKAAQAVFRKQLGLNLDFAKTVKRPMPVLVITHLSPPTPN